MRKKPLLFLTLSHFCVDSYGTMLAPVLPLIIERLGLTLAMAGLLGTILAVCNLTQPLMGIWGDRMRRRNLIVGGALLSSIFTPLLGVAPNYAILATVLILGGIGVSAFHPQAFALVGDLCAEKRAFGVALFAFGGTLGIGFSPLWVPHYVNHFGIQALPLVTLPGLVAILLVGRHVPLENARVKRVRFRELMKSLGRSASPLTLITAVVVLRTITFVGVGFFLTQLARERGLSLVEGGIPLAIYNLSGVTGSLVAGYAADRFNSKRIVYGSILLSCPALMAFLQSSGPMGYIWLAIAGIGIMASNSILVAVAQELAPENASFASSLPLGFSWGLASFALPAIGYLADKIGVAAALYYLAVLPLVTGSLALFLPERQPSVSRQNGR